MENCKLEAKFLGLFRVLHPVSKQAYKLKLPKKWRIHDVFYVSLPEQNTTKKRQMNDMQLKFEAGDDKEYKVDSIWDSAVYAKQSAEQLSGLYYLVLWKKYSEKKNTSEPILAIQHRQKLVTAYLKNNSKKPTVTSAPINMTLSIARPTTLLIARLTAAPTKKHGQPAKSTTITTTKQAKKF